MNNPIDLRLPSIFSNERQASLVWEILSGERIDNTKALAIINEEISLGEIGDMYDSLHNQDGHEMMITAGYDGIVSDLGNEQIEYVVFRTEQISILEIDRGESRGYFR